MSGEFAPSVTTMAMRGPAEHETMIKPRILHSAVGAPAVLQNPYTREASMHAHFVFVAMRSYCARCMCKVLNDQSTVYVITGLNVAL